MIARERNSLVAEHVVENHEAGLLYVEGRLVERLAPGRHAFWTAGRKIEVKRLDLRPQALEITAQEMLTKDRIALRVTLTAFRRIADPERAVAVVANVDEWLYRLVQFAIREAVASRTLDEVLSAKNALDAELRAFVRERVAETGIEVTELGVKDVILPGEVRELVNKVVEAERLAKANLIRRQEETAATRSLLNTAKLMEDNPLLLRLKELESIERLVEKVGRIDLHAGEGAGLRCAAHEARAAEGARCCVMKTEGRRRETRPLQIFCVCGGQCLAGVTVDPMPKARVEPQGPCWGGERSISSGTRHWVTPDVRAPRRSVSCQASLTSILRTLTQPFPIDQRHRARRRADLSLVDDIGEHVARLAGLRRRLDALKVVGLAAGGPVGSRLLQAVIAWRIGGRRSSSSPCCSRA